VRKSGVVLRIGVHNKIISSGETSESQILQHAYIVASHFIKDKLTRGGVNPNLIQRVAPFIFPLHEYQRKPESKTLLYVGRLSEEKGLRTLIEAAPHLPDWTFKIVGEGPMKGELERLVREKSMKHVKLLGYIDIDDLQMYYQSASFLLLPSDCYEIFPTVLLEAWRVGTPVICARQGGMAEAMVEGKTGFMFDPRNPQDLVQTVRNAGSVDVGLMKDDILNYFNSHYSPDAHYEALMEIYQSSQKKVLC